MRISALVLKEISPSLCGRIYIESEFNNKFAGDLFGAVKYVEDTVNNSDQHINSGSYQFLVGIAWAENFAKNLDLLGWGRGPWEDNLDIHKWTFREGIYQKDDPYLTCENGVLIMSREIELRRRCANINQFVNFFPCLKDLKIGPDLAVKY
nr:hypothetical protein [Nanoarchaeum sp.]